MEIVVYVTDEDGNVQRIWESSVHPDTEVSTQKLTSEQTVFNKDGSPAMSDELGVAKREQVENGMAVWIAAPLKKGVEEPLLPGAIVEHSDNSPTTGAELDDAAAKAKARKARRARAASKAKAEAETTPATTSTAPAATTSTTATSPKKFPLSFGSHR